MCEVFHKDFCFQNKELPISIIASSFTDCSQNIFPHHFIIATDGSKSLDYTSIAGLSSTQQFSYRIHPTNPIFTTEALAICQALDELAITGQDIFIISDIYLRELSTKKLSFHSP